jgi:hypothetical protein
MIRVLTPPEGMGFGFYRRRRAFLVVLDGTDGTRVVARARWDARPCGGLGGSGQGGACLRFAGHDWWVRALQIRRVALPGAVIVNSIA